MKKLKGIIIAIIMVALVVGYYFYLSNKDYSNNKKNETTNSAIEKLTTRNYEGEYYPDTPSGVVDLYSQIVTTYYTTGITDDQIESLGKLARKLFDEELLANNPEDDFYKNLKLDIKSYNELSRIIYDYEVQSQKQIKMFTFEENKYAVCKAQYYLREKSDFAIVTQEYTLRKDENGEWKILFWTAVSAEENLE